MPIEKPSTTTVALVVGVLAVAAGVGAVGLLTAGDQPSPPVGHDASDRYAALDGLTATVETTVDSGDETNRTLRDVAMRPATGQVRLEPAGNATANETVVVANGSAKWSYDPETRLVSRTDAGRLSERLRTRGKRIESLFERAIDSGGAETASAERTPGVSPLPVAPQVPDTPDAPAPNRSEGRFTVTYDGTASVAGREVHVLHVRPSEGAATDVSQTLWVDAEWFVPLKYETEWTEDGDPVTTTVEYRDVTVEPGLEADAFTYEPPADAAVVTPRLGVNAAERITDIDGLTGTLTRRYRGGNFTDDGDGPVETVQRVKRVPGTNKQRLRVLDTYGTDHESAELIVTNGSVSWRYDRDANNATRLAVATGASGRQYEWIEQLFAQLNRTRTTPDDGDASVPNPGLSPVPGADGVTTPQLPAGEFGVSLDRATQVDGRTTYVLEIRPETGSNQSTLENYAQTLWIDAETFFPVKQRTRFGTGEDRFSVTVTYRNLSVTDGFEPGTFTFEPPASADVTRSDPLGAQTYDSPEETVESAPFPVAEPTVPPGFGFRTGRVSDTEYVETVTLGYRNETSRLIVTAYEANESAFENVTGANGSVANGTDNGTAAGQSGERIRLGNRTARYTHTGLSRSVSWACGDVEYSVGGTFVSRPLVVQVAASMACPGAD